MKLAVFDLDGTLVDTAPDLWRSLDHCLAAAGLASPTLDVVRPHAGHGTLVMLDKAYEWEGRELVEPERRRQLDRFLAYYEAHIADESRPFPGAVAAMDRLTAAGYRLAVCTNKREALAVLLLETLGLADRFEAVCGADTFAHRKPHPDHLEGTIARAGGQAGDAVMIGDTSTDTDAAKALGLPCILLDFGYAPDARAKADAAAVITGYAELTPELCDDLIANAALTTTGI